MVMQESFLISCENHMNRVNWGEINLLAMSFASIFTHYCCQLARFIKEQITENKTHTWLLWLMAFLHECCKRWTEKQVMRAEPGSHLYLHGAHWFPMNSNPVPLLRVFRGKAPQTLIISGSCNGSLGQKWLLLLIDWFLWHPKGI